VGYASDIIRTDVQEYLSTARYCFGGGIAAHLVPFKTLDSIVLCHPSMLTEASIKAIDVGYALLGFIYATSTHPCFRYPPHGLARKAGPISFVLCYHELTLETRGRGILQSHALEG